MDCRLLGSSAHEILQARILEWVAMHFSRGSSWPMDKTCVSCSSCIAGRFFTAEPPGKPICHHLFIIFYTLFSVALLVAVIHSIPKTPLQLTCVEKWAEGEGAVLLVKGEVEDVQVTDAYHLHGFLIPDATFITYECLEAFWGLIHIHAVREMRWEAGAMFFLLTHLLLSQPCKTTYSGLW